jgi:shikimate dehydrogenase
MTLEPCRAPTFYFVGVSTTKSSIMKVFPKWAEILRLDAEIVGIDVPLGAPAEIYRAIVEHMRDDPLVRGALVTTHKIDLFRSAHDLFDDLDSYARLCGEISCIVRRDGRLLGFAKDPISSGLAWRAFVPQAHFAHTDAKVLCFGSGGAAIATTVFLASAPDRPKRFTLMDVRPARLHHARKIHLQLQTDIQFDYILKRDSEQNDRLLAALPPGSVVINATGMGKDLPGSPITDSAIFPQNGLIWEFNYRGELNFLHQARRQAESRGLMVEDGWVYFLHGWTQVMAEIWHIDLTPELFARLGEAARTIR